MTFWGYSGVREDFLGFESCQNLVYFDCFRVKSHYYHQGTVMHCTSEVFGTKTVPDGGLGKPGYSPLPLRSQDNQTSCFCLVPQQLSHNLPQPVTYKPSEQETINGSGRFITLLHYYSSVDSSRPPLAFQVDWSSPRALFIWNPLASHQYWVEEWGQRAFSGGLS